MTLVFNESDIREAVVVYARQTFALDDYEFDHSCVVIAVDDDDSVEAHLNFPDEEEEE